jgi:hypothetical protein
VAVAVAAGVETVGLPADAVGVGPVAGELVPHAAIIIPTISQRSRLIVPLPLLLATASPGKFETDWASSSSRSIGSLLLRSGGNNLLRVLLCDSSDQGP